MNAFPFVATGFLLGLLLCAGCSSPQSATLPPTMTPVVPPDVNLSATPGVPAPGASAAPPTEVPIKPESHTFASKGWDLFEQGLYAEAIREFEKALSVDPNNYHALKGKGFSLQRLRRYPEALKAFDTAISLNPEDPDSWLGRGIALHGIENYNASMEAFEHAIALDPGNSEAWGGKGNVYFALMMCREAIEAYDRALELDPGNPWVGDRRAKAGNPSYCSPRPTVPATPKATTPAPEVSSSRTISGYIYDCSYPYRTNMGIEGALVQSGDSSTRSGASGFFNLTTVSGLDPELKITAPGFHPYNEVPSRMVNGGFHLIPESVYRGIYLVVWNPEESNPQNWLRKWEEQTQFVIVRTGASQKQLDSLLAILSADKYRNMTGGRFSSVSPPLMVDAKPAGSDREGKTVISFAPGIEFGGIGHSESWDNSGIISTAQITWDTNQEIAPTFVWHEMVHTVTTGGHINEWPSVVSEVEANGTLYPLDEKIFNCIYNSPPRRSN